MDTGYSVMAMSLAVRAWKKNKEDNENITNIWICKVISIKKSLKLLNN
jgi:hypothetical protein